MKRILLAVVLAGCAGKQSVPTSEASDSSKPKAADFTLSDTDGNQVQLQGLLKQGPVILAFFPKAFSGGCTKEMQAYKMAYERVAAKGAQVVAVSTDDVDTLKKFKDSLGANFIFLSDPDGSVAKQYGGVAPEGYANRRTYVIAPDGSIGHTDADLAAIVPDQAIEACPFAKKPTTI